MKLLQTYNSNVPRKELGGVRVQYLSSVFHFYKFYKPRFMYFVLDGTEPIESMQLTYKGITWGDYTS